MIFSLYFLSSLYLFFFGFLFFCFGLYFLLFNLFFVFDWEFLMLNSCSMSLSFIFDWMSLMFVSCVFFIWAHDFESGLSQIFKNLLYQLFHMKF